jgi:hypothetical protein
MMAHYAFLDSNNVVTAVIAGCDENDTATGVSDWELFYGHQMGQVCKRTSYNTMAGEHALGGTPFRKNFAAVGYVYDEAQDAFIPPKLVDDAVFNETSCVWEVPSASYSDLEAP